MELLGLLLLLLACCSGSDSQAPEATVSTGRLQGTWLQSRGGRTIAAFQGVPYAAPPLGELRFQAPQPPLPWQGVRLANASGSQCLQKSSSEVVGDEDCLFLDVYAPQNATGLDIVVFVHGGAFYGGSASKYTPEFLLDQDVILVSINYRVGPFGFLSLLDDVIPGNAGLKDQVQALRWIKENIKAFGGNPDSVTIYGQSAGSVSLHLHTLSPLAKGLFHKGIGQSGTATSPWGFYEPGQALSFAGRLAKVLNCPSHPSVALRDCLLGLPGRDIISAEYDLFGFERLGVSLFKPVAEAASVEGAYLTRQPRDILLSSGPLSDVPLLMGYNSQDGGYVTQDVYENETALEYFNSKFHSFLPDMLNAYGMPKHLVRDTTNQLRRFYYQDGDVSNETRQNSIDLFTDVYFLWSTVQTLELLYKHQRSPIYLYEFAYKSLTAVNPGTSDNPEYGVVHEDDLMYSFPISSSIVRTDHDVEVSKYFVKLLTNFAMKGSPTEEGYWSPVQRPQAPQFLRITSPSDSRMHWNCAPERMQFWNQLPVPIGEGL